MASPNQHEFDELFYRQYPVGAIPTFRNVLLDFRDNMGIGS
jgi:hypothetical protein